MAEGDIWVKVRLDRSANGSSGPASSITFTVPVAGGHKRPEEGDEIRIERLDTVLGQNKLTTNFDQFEESLKAFPGEAEGAAEAVKVIEIEEATPVDGYQRIKVRPISSSDEDDDVEDVRVIGMGTADITNVLPAGTKGILAVDSKNGDKYFLTNKFVFIE